MARDGTHTKQSGARLGASGIVVRVRVDVVGVDLAIAVRDNFDTRNTDAIGSQKALVSRDQRIFVSVSSSRLYREGPSWRRYAAYNASVRSPRIKSRRRWLSRSVFHSA